MKQPKYSRTTNPLTGRRGPENGATPEELAEKEALKAAGQAQKDVSARVAVTKFLLAAAEARERFMPFIRFTSPDPDNENDPFASRYKNARHHDAVARAIEAVVAGDIPFLILCMPPRHGKSEQVSRRLPAWFLGLYPSQEVVVATYSDTFAEDFGDEVRKIMYSKRYKQVFPGTMLAKGGSAKDRLKTTVGGGAVFVGRGGALTGRGAHLLIIDDLIKDDKEAQSQAIRDQAWSWLTKVALSRRRGKKLVVMTFTRWHSDDPIGRLTDPENPYYSRTMAEKIKIINLPAIAEEDDPMGRAVGEPLWPDGPDKFDLDFLNEMKVIDPVGFSALYQQRPTAADGVLFRRENIRYYRREDLVGKELRYYCASDHAVATGQRNDYTVLLKVGVDQFRNIYLIDCFWARVRSDAAVEAMLAMAAGQQAPLLWWGESGQISKSIGPFLYTRMQETGTYINMREMSPIGDKEQRAQSIAAMVAMGKVYFPVDSVWTEKAINQMMGFPAGTHDDFVDALAYIGLGLRSQFTPAPLKAEKKEPAFGTLAWVKRHDRWKAEQDAARRHGGF